jgi:dihydrofolate reductase
LPTDRKRKAAASGSTRGGPKLQIHRSGQLAQTLMRHGLIDVYELLVFPVVLGEGKRRFETGIDRAMRLAGSRTTDSGLAVSTYEPAGELAFGSVDAPRSS